LYKLIFIPQCAISATILIAHSATTLMTTMNIKARMEKRGGAANH
jgi:hypothetical protein